MPVDVSDDVTVDVADVVCVVLVVGEVVGDEVSDVDGVVDGLVVGEVDVVRVVVGEVVWVVMMHSLLKSPSWYVLMALLTKSTVVRQASIVEKVIPHRLEMSKIRSVKMIQLHRILETLFILLYACVYIMGFF